MFFRKGKAACWKVVEKNETFISTFTALGSDWNLTEVVINDLEEFVCILYGYRQKEVNNVRNALFEAKYINQNKAIDMSLLPPCQASLRLHTLRSNVVARIWKLSGERQIQMPDLSQHCWTIDNQIKWIEKAFPDEVEELLLNEEEEEVYEEDEESEEENDS